MPQRSPHPRAVSAFERREASLMRLAERLVKFFDPLIVHLMSAVRRKAVDGYAVVLGLQGLGYNNCCLFLDIDDFRKAAWNETVRRNRQIHQKDHGR